MADETNTEATDNKQAATETKVTETPKPVVARDPNKVEIDATELEEMRKQIRETTKAKADADEAERLKREETLKAKGEYEKLLKDRDTTLADKDGQIAARDQKYADLQRTTATAIAERDLVTALPTGSLVEHAAEQLKLLLGAQIEAKVEGGTWTTKAKDGSSVADFVKAQLALPQYQHFLKADARGGAGGKGNTATPTNRNGETFETEGHRMVAALRGKVNPNVSAVPGSANYQRN